MKKEIYRVYITQEDENRLHRMEFEIDANDKSGMYKSTPKLMSEIGRKFVKNGGIILFMRSIEIIQDRVENQNK